MKKKIKVGVIGLGVGEQHIIGYKRNPQVSVEAICDLDKKKLKKISSKYKIEKIFSDWQILLEQDLDAVSICSYDNYHSQQAIRAFNNGIHCMIEKPIALNKKDSEKILRAQQNSKKIITSNLILRQSPRFQKLKKEISNGSYGKIVYGEADYLHYILWKITKGWRGRMPFYCTMYGGGIHLVDLIRWLISSEVEEVTGISNNIQTKNSKYKYDDLIAALLKFKTGSIFKTVTNFGSVRNKFHALNIYGTKKTFTNDVPNAFYYDEYGDDVRKKKISTKYKSSMDKYALINNFINSIKNNCEPIVKSVDVFRVMDVCFSTYESIKKKKTIKVSYLI